MTTTDQQQPIKRRRGCLFYGCLTSCILVLVVLAGLILGYLKILNAFDTKPAALPTVDMSDADMQQVRQRVDSFRNDVRSAHQTQPLSLTANEINALIATDPNLKALKGRVYVDIEGSQVKGQISVPTSDVGLGFFKHRYINGSGAFNIALTNGTLFLSLQSLANKGQPIPEKYMQLIRAKNLAQGINDDPKASAGLNKLKSIEVKDGKIVIVPTPPPQ
jgi:hypothetical protein